jgi:UDP-glucose:(heptosyl)LPS alpha-1,3-glucosyltransferase
MRIAVGITSLFPGGGLQRDCIEIAKLIRGSGHVIVIYTARLTGAVVDGDIPVIVIPNSERTNHARHYQFAREFMRQTSGNFDLVVGFDKLLGLDVLYCADRSIYYRLLDRRYLGLFARYRTYTEIEGDSFGPGRKTRIILLSQNQRIEYRDAWRTEPERLIELPPTLSAARRKPQCRVNGAREQLRNQLGLSSSSWVWLAIGVQPKTKGLDRTLRALQYFPQATLLVAGLNDIDDRAKRSARMARRLGVASRVIWLGHREDIEHATAASDILVHPARYDTTGTVILEAVVNGLPVITSSVCGYAKHVQAAGAGIVLGEPFDFRLFLAAIRDMLEPTRRDAYSQAGAAYGQNKQLYEGRQRAAELMIQLAEIKLRGNDIADLRLASAGSEESDNVVSLPLGGRK